MRGGLDLKHHSFQKLSEKTITDAITYLEARFAQPEQLVSAVPYHQKKAVSSHKLGTFRREFEKFVISTTGLITWPSSIADEFEMDVRKTRSGIGPCTLALLVILIVAAAATYYLLSLDLLWVCLLVVGPLGLSVIYVYLIVLFNTIHLFGSGSNWIHHIKKSDSIQLEEAIGEIFDLLKKEFPSPLRFYLIGDYSQLKYTGRTKTSDTLVRWKEAILYPKLMDEKEESTGA